ncbi:enolase C-terminal domain-like protein [Streptomyces scopuliridis]
MRDHVPAYTQVGDDYHDRDRFLERCRALVRDGRRQLRFTAPHGADGVLDARRCLRDSVELFHQVRETVGDEVELILDAHTRLDPPEALALCREIEAARPYFVEDPLRCEKLES